MDLQKAFDSVSTEPFFIARLPLLSLVQTFVYSLDMHICTYVHIHVL